MEEPVIVETIDSTNAELLRRLSKGEKLHKTALIAYEQTAGRGRTGRRFYSPKNTGVYFSFVYEPQKELVDPALITARAAVSLMLPAASNGLTTFMSTEKKSAEFWWKAM